MEFIFQNLQGQNIMSQNLIAEVEILNNLFFWFGLRDISWVQWVKSLKKVLLTTYNVLECQLTRK